VALAAGVSATACGSGSQRAAHATTPVSSTTTPPTVASTTTSSTTTTPSPTTTAPRQETTTTVLGPHGNPSGYPAAQSQPPSLAGAVPTTRTVDLVSVLTTLETYRDWVWSHPDPADVARYDDPADPDYSSEVATLTQLGSLRLHASPAPTTILWARVKAAPNLIEVRDGRETFEGGELEAVFDWRAVPLLTASGKPSGRSYHPPRTGLVACLVTFAQSPAGQWRIRRITDINPPGGTKKLIRS
jgi:hypothetical protein